MACMQCGHDERVHTRYTYYDHCVDCWTANPPPISPLHWFIRPAPSPEEKSNG